jgi:NaMN:DMB phosphoribosyltransferase
MDPFTALTVGLKAVDFIGAEFGGPSAAQIAAAQAAAEAAQRRQLYIAGGLVGAAVLVAILLRR